MHKRIYIPNSESHVCRSCASWIILLVGTYVRLRWVSIIRFCCICFTPTTFMSTTQEARLRYYLDEGRTSVPQFGPPTSAPAFSVSSEVKSTSSEVVSSAPGSESSHLGLGYPVPMPTFDGESTTPICSLCAARLSADSQAPKEDEELGGDKRKFFPSRPSLLSYFSVPFRH